MGGIGSHLKVSQVDQSVCLGNELNNLSARKDFLLKNIKSSHPILYLPGFKFHEKQPSCKIKTHCKLIVHLVPLSHSLLKDQPEAGA